MVSDSSKDGIEYVDMMIKYIITVDEKHKDTLSFLVSNGSGTL